MRFNEARISIMVSWRLQWLVQMEWMDERKFVKEHQWRDETLKEGKGTEENGDVSCHLKKMRIADWKEKEEQKRVRVLNDIFDGLYIV